MHTPAETNSRQSYPALPLKQLSLSLFLSCPKNTEAIIHEGCGDNAGKVLPYSNEIQRKGKETTPANSNSVTIMYSFVPFVRGLFRFRLQLKLILHGLLGWFLLRFVLLAHAHILLVSEQAGVSVGANDISTAAASSSPSSNHDAGIASFAEALLPVARRRLLLGDDVETAKRPRVVGRRCCTPTPSRGELRKSDELALPLEELKSQDVVFKPRLG